MAPTLPPLVLTGASGFIGRHMLHALAERGAIDVTVLARAPERLQHDAAWCSGWRALRCDLETDAIPTGTISPATVVLHMAASTGNMSPSAMSAVNVGGTVRVIEAAQKGGARHLIFVSSIAAGFANMRWYHYGRAKREAERVVAASGVPSSIVRPTMVFGPGSPIEVAMTSMATGGLPIVLGSGTVRVQPVHVDDVVTLLLALAADAPAGRVPLEVGGADRVTLRDLLASIRAKRSLAPRRPWSISLGLLRLLLGVFEPVVRPLLPVTAGQLAAFLNHSDAVPNVTVARLLPSPRGLEAMLAAAPAHG